jgi:hypothetical protein
MPRSSIFERLTTKNTKKNTEDTKQKICVFCALLCVFCGQFSYSALPTITVEALFFLNVSFNFGICSFKNLFTSGIFD